MGRSMVPTSIKEARGTVRRDRANPAEPRPASLELGAKPPTWLVGPRRRHAWADLVELLSGQNVLTTMDALSLAMLVDAYGDYLEASDLIRGRACSDCGRRLHKADAICSTPAPGRRYYTSSSTVRGEDEDDEPVTRVIIRAHPAMAERKDAWKRVCALIDRFGMNPVSRPKVGRSAPVDVDPMDELLDGHRSA